MIIIVMLRMFNNVHHIVKTTILVVLSVKLTPRNCVLTPEKILGVKNLTPKIYLLKLIS